MDTIRALQQLISNTESSNDEAFLLDFSRLCRICLTECTELCDLYQTVTFEEHQEELQLKDVIDTFIAHKVKSVPDISQYLYSVPPFRLHRTMICPSICA